MLSITILGTGNLATHLFQAFNNAKNIEIQQVYGRNKKALKAFEAHGTTTSFSLKDLLPSDIYVLSISDDSISEVSKSLSKREGLIVHTSGAVSLTAIKGDRKGVFYPLQTFTKGKKVDFTEIPICVEAENKNDLQLLQSLGRSISQIVCEISTEQRQKLHLSAVLVNNFPNHLFHLAQSICDENNIPFSLLKPLIFETVNKIRHLSPEEAQTGPAKRDDIMTMQRHMDQLQDPLQKKIYQLLSESIKAHYEKEL